MRDIDDTRAMVRQTLAMLGVTEPDETENGYGGRAGSTRVMVFVRAEPDKDRTLLQVRAEVARYVPLSPELYEYVACSALQYLFGTLGVIPGDGGVGLVVMAHSLLAEHCSSELLAVVVAAIGSTADSLDNEVVSRFGGSVCFPE